MVHPQVKSTRHRIGLVPRSRARNWLEGLLLGLLSLVVILGPWLFGSVRWWSVGPQVLLVWLAFTCFMARHLWTPWSTEVKRPPALLPALLFLGYAGVSIGRAAVPYDATIEVLKAGSLVAAYWMWADMGNYNKRWRVLLAAVFLSATIMAGYALVQEAHHSRMVLNLVRPVDYGFRASGAYICPNHFANLLVLLLPMALSVAMSRAGGISLRLLSAYAVVIFLPAIYLTQSRSGWIGLFVGVTVTLSLLALRQSLRKFLLVLLTMPLAGSAIGLVAWLASPMVRVRIADALQGNVRLDLWQDALAMWHAHPWLGFGPAAFRWVYPKFREHMIAFVDPQFAHNEYLHALVDYGVLGTALMLITGGVLLWKMIHFMLAGNSDRDKALIVGFAGALAASAAHAFFDYNFQIFANAHVLALLAGLAATGLADDSRRAWPLTEKPSRLLIMAGALTLGGALLTLYTAGAILSYSACWEGEKARLYMQYEPAERSYGWALKVMPSNWRASLGMGHMRMNQALWNHDAGTRKKQIQDAEIYYSAVLEGNPWETEALYGLSKVSLARKDEEKTLTLLRELANQAPYHQFYLTQLGLQLRFMGHREEALAVFKQAARVGSPTPAIQLNIRLLEAQTKHSP